MRLSNLWWLLILLLTVGASPLFLQPKDTAAWIIEPNSGVGPFKINTIPRPDLVFSMGKPAPGNWFPTIGVRLSRLVQDGSIEIIELAKPFAGKTAEGLGIGTPEKLVLQAYPKIDRFTDSNNPLLVAFKTGIGFRLDKRKRVARIGLFKWSETGFPDSLRAAATERMALLPGTGVANVMLGRSRAKTLMEAFGSPDQVERHKTGTMYFYRGMGVVARVNPSSLVVADLFLVAPFRGKTQRGIGVHSSMAAVKKAYGEAAVDYISLRYPKRGIDFQLNGSRVMLMHLYHP